ncbi:Sec63 domain [Trypanosoma melophagium]|uniref:Sec63 domain n=1 Tax=Trypanosoma melophagium TaxID=715481 RepID=UPI00351A41B1|nr:Sec63 domain [Trypanosoma melophagium]
MSSAAHYVPHSEQTRVHYERFLRDLRRWLPPGLDDNLAEIAEETLSIVCRFGSSSSSGAAAAPGSMHLQELKKQLELLFDTPLSAEALHEVLHYGRLIDDFVVAEEVGNRHRVNDNGIEANDGLGGLLLLQEDNQQQKQKHQGEISSDSDDDDDDDNNNNNNMTGVRDNRMDLMKFAADVDIIGDGNVEYDDGDDDDGVNNNNNNTGGRVKRVTFEEIACNPNYVRDSLRRLFPTQTMDECELQAGRVLQYAAQPQVDQLTLETQLTAFLGGYDDEAVMEWIGTVAQSRWAIVYGMRFAEGHNQEAKNTVIDAMKAHAHQDRTVERLYQSVTGKEIGLKTEVGDGVNSKGTTKPLRRVDLQAYAFKDERTPHQHTRAVVPQGTQRAVFETHDEVILPPTPSATGDLPCIPINNFPEWAQLAFPGVSQLNPMQSKVYDCAFNSDENMLVCAPTGAGKTNVATMTMLRAIANATTRSGNIKLRDLKMVYVAPMKALVQEVVRTFSKRFEPIGLTVVELSGDSSINQAQLYDAQLIVTTPEKWDVVTRKSVELGVATLLKLLILDEVHLLHNERGPVLEAIVARTMLQQQLRGEANIRIVGLSATLPNHIDVASFLQVDRQRGLFVFDSSFRPIPLQQSFCAIKKVRGTNQAAVMNLVSYDKVLQAAINGEQTMVFVHSRKDTEYTALYMMRRAVEDKRTHYFVRPGSESEQALRDAANTSTHLLRASLQQMLPMGFAVHHAGMSREEREVVETLFAERHVRVLVCTSTLAWGVNLPANQVVIKGTRIFNGAKGETELLSALDVLQMFGRAGRVGFGTSLGRAAVITGVDDLQYYLAVLNQQLPIESQLMARLVDMLNAEIVLGHIETTAEGVRWLQRTYMYVRLRRTPELYGTRASDADPLFLHHLENIVHTAAEDLRRAQMVDYDVNARRIAPTPYGRIASFYYVTSSSMATYLTHLTSTMHDVDLFRLFAMSKEFSHITVRPEEQAQLQYLLENAPIAVRESRYTPLAKINILLQCYISDMSLQGLPLMSELVYVKDSAQRILRALHETCLVREYGRTAMQVLQLCLMVVHQQWGVQSPVRQLRHTVTAKNFATFIHALESRRVSWDEVRAWSLEDLSEKLGDERRAELAYDSIHQVPHFILEASVRPLTRNMLYVDVDITPEFTYNETLHSRAAGELLLTIEHTNGRILHHERVYLSVEILRGNGTFSAPTIVVPIVEPKPTHYFVRCHSLHWLGTECSVAVCLMNVRLPDIAPPLLEVHLRPPSLEDDESMREVSATLKPYGLEAAAEKVFPFTEFFPTQHDLVVPIMENPTENIFVAIPPGGGRTTIAELFILQFLLDCALLQTETSTSSISNNDDNGTTTTTTTNNNNNNNNNAPITEEEQIADGIVPATKRKLLYITAHDACATRRLHDWRCKFGEGLKQYVVKLEPFGEGLETKMEKVRNATIIIASGGSLLPLLRRGGNDYLTGVTHIIVDHIHLIRAPEGRWMEECIARLQSKPYLVNNGKQPARLLALSYPLISCTEVSRWMKIPQQRQYNYGNSYRQLRVRLEAVDHGGARNRYEAATVSALKLLQRDRYASTPSVVFVPSARDTEELAKRVLLRCRDFVPTTYVDEVEDRNLSLLLSAGVAYMHRGTSFLDELFILDRVENPSRHPETEAILPLILICTFESAWRLPAALFGTAFVCAAERTAAAVPSLTFISNDVGGSSCTDCSVSELLQMTSRALSEAVVYCRAARRWVWGKLLNDPLPLESYLRYPDDFRDALNAAIAQGRVMDMPTALRVLQSHYFLFHLRTNLHFYGVPTREDIPAYASEFARVVIAALQQAGCLTVMDNNNNSNTNNDDDNDNNIIRGDEGETVRPTPRGKAAAQHGMSVVSVEAITTATAASASHYMGGRGEDGQTLNAGTVTTTSTTTLSSVADMWRLVASSCVELTPPYVGDAARITDTAELQALQTIARAFPSAYDVRYVDLDFSKGWTKVLLLILAHCARMFISEEHLKKYETRNDSVTAIHPLASPSSAAVDPHLLLDISYDVAEQLRADLYVLLPAVLDLVRGACEIFDNTTQWRQARYLMRLASHIERRVWGCDDALLQLPCVQESAALHQVLNRKDKEGLSWSLERLQELSSQGPAAEVVWLKLTNKLVECGVVPDTNAGAALVKRLCAEAVSIPRVTSMTANGTVELMDAGHAFVIHVEGSIACTLPLASSFTSTVANDELASQSNRNKLLGPWWILCVLRHQGKNDGSERLMALSVVTPECVADNNRNEENEEIKRSEQEQEQQQQHGQSSSLSSSFSSMWRISASLTFPLEYVDGEDLDTLTMTASVVSAQYRADAETDVVFAAE